MSLVSCQEKQRRLPRAVAGGFDLPGDQSSKSHEEEGAVAAPAAGSQHQQPDHWDSDDNLHLL